MDYDKRLSFESKNAALFWRLLEAKEPAFGGIKSKVSVEWNDAGAAIAFKNLVSEYSGIELKTFQRNALVPFDNAIGKDDKIPQAPHRKRTLDPANVGADKVTFL